MSGRTSRPDSDAAAGDAEAARVGTSKRDHPHSSGDRNTREREDAWPRYEGGTQRDADPAGATSDEDEDGVPD